MLRNSTLWAEFSHTVLAALVTGAMVVLGVSGWQLLRGGNAVPFTRSAWVAAWVALVSTVAVMVTGDIQARLMDSQQPMKMAAAEAVYRTQSGASFSLTTLIGSEVDELDPFVGRVLPRAVLALAVPALLLAWIAGLDPVSAGLAGGILLLAPVLAGLVGADTAAAVRRRMASLERMADRFDALVAGLPLLRAFGRAAEHERAVAASGEEVRTATLATLRSALLAGLVLELLAAMGTALVAVRLGLRLDAGQRILPRALAVLMLVLPPERVRGLLAWSPEQPVLFPASLRANLRLGAPQATDGEMTELLGRFGLAPWLDRLERGLDTVLAPWGHPVSGGELQRLSLARAVLSGRPVLVLDEPTSHLDQATAAAVLDAVLEHARGRSVLWVTHRPAELALFPDVRHLRGGMT